MITKYKPNRTVGPPITRPPIPRDDRYGQDDKKSEGYTLGAASAFLDGRLLRNCIFGTTWGRVNTANLATTDLAAQVAAPVPTGRGLYINQILYVALVNANANLEARWQMHIGGKFVRGGPWQISPIPICIYVPPLTNVTFYYYVVNNVGAEVWTDFAVEWTEFDSHSDPWDWGQGNRAPNPAAPLGAAAYP